jgi:ABC-type transport system substrate-binding protein
VKARNTALLMILAIGLYACGGGGSGSSMSAPVASMPPPAAPPPPASMDYTPESVAALASSADETSDPTTFDPGATVNPSDDQTSDPMAVTGQ